MLTETAFLNLALRVGKCVRVFANGDNCHTQYTQSFRYHNKENEFNLMLSFIMTLTAQLTRFIFK